MEKIKKECLSLFKMPLIQNRSIIGGLQYDTTWNCLLGEEAKPWGCDRDDRRSQSGYCMCVYGKQLKNVGS